MPQTHQVSEFVQSNVPATVINFAIGQPSPFLLPNDIVSKAAQKNLVQDMPAEMLAYGIPKGYKSFCESLAAFISKEERHHLPPENVMASGGNSSALSLCCSTLIETNSIVAVEDPTYFLAAGILRGSGVTIITVPTDDEGLVTDELEAMLKSGTVIKAIYTIPTFQNPRGSVLPLGRRQHLLRLANEYNFYIFSDEPYSCLNYEVEGVPSSLPAPLWALPGSDGRVLSMGSFSKILGPGLRLGWIISSPPIIKKLTDHGILSSGGCVNPIATRIVHSIIDSGDLSSYLVKLRTCYAERLTAMTKSLNENFKDCSFVAPYGGYFLWLKLPSHIKSSVLHPLASSKFNVSFGAGFRACANTPPTPSLDSYIRLCFAFYTTEEIVEGLGRLRLAMNSISDGTSA